jgi:hypothetical protein
MRNLFIFGRDDEAGGHFANVHDNPPYCVNDAGVDAAASPESHAGRVAGRYGYTPYGEAPADEARRGNAEGRRQKVWMERRRTSTRQRRTARP